MILLNSKIKIAFVSILIFVISSIGLTSQAQTLTRADCAKILSEVFSLRIDIEKRDKLYGLLDNGFPAGYDGITSLSYAEEPCTLEVAIVAAIWNSGVPIVSYSTEDINKVKEFVSAEGIPEYEPLRTPRSIPFVLAALKLGLLKESELKKLDQVISKEKVFKVFNSALKLKNDKSSTLGLNGNFRTLRNLNDLDQIGNRYNGIVILDASFPHGPIPREILNLNVLDLRGPNPRFLTNGGGGLGTGDQNYFPLGPLSSSLTASMNVTEYSLDHQSQAVHGSTESSSKTVNAIGVWGSALSREKDARIWGSFFNVTNTKDKDAQLVGSEIDVTNYALPGEYPNASKVGLQVVGLGTANNTNGIEILAADSGQWKNAILIGKNTVAENGAILGVSQDTAVQRGIDFGNTDFSDSAIKIKQGSQIVWNEKNGRNSGIYLAQDNGFESDKIVIRAGSKGFSVVDITGTRVLLSVDEFGNVNSNTFSNTISENKIMDAISFIALAMSIFTLALTIGKRKRRTN